MTMDYALLLGILPAGLLVWAGHRLRAAATDEEGAARWLLFLLGTLSLLLVALAIATSIQNPIANISSAALLPAGWGILAALIVDLLSNRKVWSRNAFRVIPLFLFALAALVWIGINADIFTSASMIMGGIAIAVVWQVWNWARRWYLAAYACQVMLLGVSIRATDAHIPLATIPAWLAVMTPIGAFLIPGMAIVGAGYLAYAHQDGDQSSDWRKVILTLLMVASLLFLIGYQITLASIWDVATDGLGGAFLSLLVSAVGIAAAMILAWSLPGRRKVIALAFAVIVPLSTLRAQAMGSYGPTGQWGTTPILLTEQRAETVNRALQRYYARKGEYPQALKDLTPWYLAYIPNPVIIPGQTWCYEGGRDYYRLGYVYRQYFSSPASVRIHAAAGAPPQPHWPCDDRAAKSNDQAP